MDNSPLPTSTHSKTNVTNFEHLSDELLLRFIFPHFDLFALYSTFYNLNHRYNQLVSSAQPLQLNIDSIPPSQFITFFSRIINLFPMSSIVSLSDYKSAHIEYLYQDDTFRHRFTHVKSITLTDCLRKYDAIKLLSLECFHNTITYASISLEDSLDSMKYEFDVNDVSGNLKYSRLFNIFLTKMKNLKTLIAHVNPFGTSRLTRSFESEINSEVKSELKYLSVDHIHIDDFLTITQLCPKLSFLEMQTDFQWHAETKTRLTSVKNTSVTHLYLAVSQLTARKQFTFSKLKVVLSHFANLKVLQMDRTQCGIKSIKEEEWSELESKLKVINVAQQNKAEEEANSDDERQSEKVRRMWSSSSTNDSSSIDHSLSSRGSSPDFNHDSD